MIVGKKIFHNNQFEAEDALRRDEATVKMVFAINTFESVVAGVKQPGSMTGFGNASFFVYSLYVRNRCGWPMPCTDCNCELEQAQNQKLSVEIVNWM